MPIGETSVTKPAHSSPGGLSGPRIERLRVASTGSTTPPMQNAIVLDTGSPVGSMALRYALLTEPDILHLNIEADRHLEAEV